MGYALFVVISFFYGWLAVPALVIIGVPLMFLLSVLRLPPKAHIAVVASASGCLWGALMFLNALLAVRWLDANPGWITGIGIALMLFASPKVMNARYAVSAAILTFFLMGFLL